MLGHSERLREPHEHALESFEVRVGGERQDELGGPDGGTARADRHRRNLRDACLRLDLGDHTGDAHHVADRDAVGIAIEDEQAVGGVGVPVAEGILKVKTAEGRRGSFEVADHDALRGDRAAGER